MQTGSEREARREGVVAEKAAVQSVLVSLLSDESAENSFGLVWTARWQRKDPDVEEREEEEDRRLLFILLEWVFFFLIDVFTRCFGAWLTGRDFKFRNFLRVLLEFFNQRFSCSPKRQATRLREAWRQAARQTDFNPQTCLHLRLGRVRLSSSSFFFSSRAFPRSASGE